MRIFSARTHVGVLTVMALIPVLLGCKSDRSSPTSGDVEVELVSVTSDSASVNAVIRVSGRSDLGDDVQPVPAFVVAANGERRFVSQAIPDTAEPRVLTLVFNGLSALPRPWTLDIDTLTFRAGIEPQGQGEAPAPVTLRGGGWRFAIPDAAKNDRVGKIAGAARLPFGPSTIVLDRVVETAEAVVVAGHLEDFDSRLAPGVDYLPTFGAPGEAGARFSGGGWGFGAGNASFEFRFPPTGAGTFEVNIAASVADENPSMAELDAAGRALLARFAGAKATWSVELP